MKIIKTATILAFAALSSISLNAQNTNRIRIDTIWVKKNSILSSFSSNLPSISSALDSTAQTSSYWYNSREKYGYDHTGTLRKLNKKLSTKIFSNVSLITFFCVKYERDYNWIRLEEWHFPTEKKAELAFKSLANIKNSGIFSVRPTYWGFIRFESKIYFLSSEYYSIKSDTFIGLKKMILNTLQLDESSVIEYSR